MATTYIKYNIYTKQGWFNNYSIATSLPVQYGGTTMRNITTAGTFYCNAAGKYANQNIVIGAKTLPTEGKYIDTNIQITTSLLYYWNKYNCISSYTTASTSVLSGSGTILSTAVANAHANGTSYSFSTGSGTFTLSGGSIQSARVAGANIMVANSISSPYFSPTSGSSASSYSEIYKVASTDSRQNLKVHFYRNDSTRYYKAIKIAGISGEYTNTYKIYRTIAYSRGSYIGEVNSTSSSAYPANARHSDGYWYTAI